MAEEEGGQPFQFTPENGKAGNSSRDYTGRGLAQYPNNDQYDGQYVDGIRNGKGKYAYANGDKYDGDFKNNLKHGIGRLIYKDKGEYYGQWENGLKHGEGTYTYANKDSYSGWWQFGKKHGRGNYTYSDTGMRLVGEWKDNKLVKGRWIFPNGTYYEGEFENNKPTKTGTWYFKDGNNLQGNYNQTIIPNEDPVYFI
jgi:radial spoke head protein 1